VRQPNNSTPDHRTPLVPGTVPPSLATQPELGTLRLEGNKLGGTLERFAAALPGRRSNLFHVDVSRNQITGPLPDDLQRLGVFAPDQAFVMSSADGQVPFTRLLNVSHNKLEGRWPAWLLSAVRLVAGWVLGGSGRRRMRGTRHLQHAARPPSIPLRPAFPLLAPAPDPPTHPPSRTPPGPPSVPGLHLPRQSAAGRTRPAPQLPAWCD